MFTGIIEEIGRIKHISRKGDSVALAIAARKILEDVHLGDSIAVNGICLTVTSFDQHMFSVDAVPETVRKTNLSKLNAGSLVNLERAMQANGRFGGHFVSGHVDGMATLVDRKTEGNAVILAFQMANEALNAYILPKGSITIDGISVTVMDVADRFRVSVIPHTLAQTTLYSKQIGDMVNIECDMIAKYIERVMIFRENFETKRKSTLTEQFLKENGFA